MTEYVFVHHFIVGVLLVMWICLAYLNVFIFFCPPSTPARRRHDFLDPDFDVKASLNLASNRKQRGNCRVGAQADSEIPELGLDSGHLSVDCDLNPARVADAAYRAAKSYGQYRRERKRYQPQSTRLVKRKRTQISVTRDYERAKVHDNDYVDDDNDSGYAHPTRDQSAAIQEDHDDEMDDD